VVKKLKNRKIENIPVGASAAICAKTKLKHDWLISHVGWL
jgi:hypothetical protein